ncbi:MAG: enoyl-CoA hydratase/isomerase family protein [Gemmatimonadota bacterium]
MSDAPRLAVGIWGGIGRATLARPELQNPIDVQTAVELRQALEEFEADHDVRAVLIAGQGDHFSGATVDLDEDKDAEDAWTLGRVFLAIRQSSKPVVAAVHGRVLAGGAGLASACDVVLAREDAIFGYPEVRQGSVPAMVMTMLRRSVGEKHAFDLVASGRMITASEAERLGLVSRVLSTAAFTAEVERVVLGLASHSMIGMATTKKLFYALDGLAFRDAIDEGVRIDAETHARRESRGVAGS